jgi:hypothetical protein
VAPLGAHERGISDGGIAHESNNAACQSSGSDATG